MQVQTRAARYHGAGSWPPALSTILNEVEKVFRKRGYFTSPKEFRGVCTSADGSYTRGGADDCMRLLKNAGALVPGVVGDKSRLLIDQAACATLQACFERNEQPHFPSLGELAKRLPVLLRALQRRTSKPKRATKPTIAPVAAIASPAATVELSSTDVELSSTDVELSSTDVELSSTHTASSQPTETQMIATAPAPAVSTDHAHRLMPVPRFVAYLPSGAACEVWTFLYVCVTDLEDFGARIAVPNGKLPDGVTCSPAEFDEWLETFIGAGVIERLGESGGDNDAFRFLVHPDEIHTVEIQERKPIKTPKVWIEVVDRARREIEREALAANRLRSQIAAWVEANFPELLGLTASQKLMGYRPDATRTDTNWGIFDKDHSRGVYLPCLPGLEPFEFVPTDFAARRINRRGQGVEAIEPQPVPTPEPTVELEPQPELTVASEPQPEPAPIAAAPMNREDLLERIREERQRLEEPERLLTALTARESKRSELAAELATLDAQIASDTARLAELGFPVR